MKLSGAALIWWLKIAAVCLAVFVGCVFLALVILPLDIDSSTATGAAVATVIATVIVAAAATTTDGKNINKAVTTPVTAADGDIRVASLLKDLKSASMKRTVDQFNLLTDKGKLEVPWTVIRPATREMSSSSRGHERSVDRLAHLLDGGTGQLLIVGRSDAGKTTMALWLMERLLSRDTDRPVPIYLRLASWNVDEMDLYRWITQEMIEEYPVIASKYEFNELLAAVTAGLILPVLDGFDEIKHNLREDAARGISRKAGNLPMIITSRLTLPAELSIQSAMLPQAAVVRLEPVELDDATAYLQAGRGLGDEPLWDGIAAVVRDGGSPALADTLSSPLMVWLARTVYAPSLQSHLDVSELLDPL